MSATTRARCAAADDRLGVVDHLGHRHADRGLVAEHDLADRVADEQQRDPGLVEQLRRRVVVGGQHRDRARRRRTACAMSTTDSRRGVAGVALMLAPDSVRRSWPQSGGRRRARPAPARPGRAAGPRPRAWTAVGSSSRDPSAPRIATRLVSVPNPEPGSLTSLATSRSTPLRRSLSAGPLERAGLGRKADQDRDAAGAASASGRRRCRAHGRSGHLGQEVRRGLELDREPRGAFQLAIGGHRRGGSRRPRRP